MCLLNRHAPLQDTVAYLLPYASQDTMFILHHIITVLFLGASLHCQLGGHAIALGLFAGEVTNPVFHIYNVLNDSRAWSPTAEAAFRWWAPFFTSFFTLVRTAIGVPMAFWWSGRVATMAAPLPHRCIWIVAAFGITAVSQLFVRDFIRSTHALLSKPAALAQPKRAAAPARRRQLQKAVDGNEPQLTIFDSATDMAYILEKNK